MYFEYVLMIELSPLLNVKRLCGFSVVNVNVPLLLTMLVILFVSDGKPMEMLLVGIEFSLGNTDIVSCNFIELLKFVNLIPSWK